MRNKLVILAVALALVGVFGAGCSNKSDEQARKVQAERERELKNFTEGVTPPPKPQPLPKSQVIEVPDSVKGKYSAVILLIGDRRTKVINKFNVKLGAEAAVPGTDYTIKVGEYLPNWVVRGKVVSSKDNKPEDPAVRAVISENGKVVFDGFIFQKHRTPSFITDKYAIGLGGAVAR